MLTGGGGGDDDGGARADGGRLTANARRESAAALRKQNGRTAKGVYPVLALACARERERKCAKSCIELNSGERARIDSGALVGDFEQHEA